MVGLNTKLQGLRMKVQKKQVYIFLIALFISIVKEDKAMPESASETSLKSEYKAKDLRDPFQLFKIEEKEKPEEQEQVTEEKVEEVPLPDLKIQGIVWGGSLPQAIINNKVVRVGDTIEEVRITDINKSGVTVFFKNGQYNLTTSSPISSQGLKKNP